MNIFQSNNFKIEVELNENNEPMFRAGDVAIVLWSPIIDKDRPNVAPRPQMSKLTNALQVVDNQMGTEVYRISKNDFITEAQLYRAIFASKSPKALDFQMWVTTEVLPSIRKNGTYIADNATTEQIQYALENKIVDMANRGQKIGYQLSKLNDSKSVADYSNSVKYIYSNIKSSERKRIVGLLLDNTAKYQNDYRLQSKDFNTDTYNSYTKCLLFLKTEEKNFVARSLGRRLSNSEKND